MRTRALRLLARIPPDPWLMAAPKRTAPLLTAFLAAGLPALSSACRSTEGFDGPETLALVAADPLPITLSAPLRSWIETDHTLGLKTTFRVGRLMRRLFTAQDGMAFLHPLHSDLSTGWDVEASTWRSTYLFQLSLQHLGTNHRLEVKGSGSSTRGPEDSGRLAIADSVDQIYRQVSAVLRGERM